MTTARPRRILILGGGFGGVYTALSLEKILKRELTRGEVEITLVSRDNYLTFQPMLPEVVSGSIGILDTITPIRRLCPRTNLYTRAIEEVDDRDACQALLSTLPPLRDFFNRLLEERVGMRPESRNALDMSNDVITMNAESLKGQIALVTGATGGTRTRVAQCR